MSYTIVVDEQERERRFENRLNAVVRRCKIGKVASKRPASIPSVFQPPMWPPTTGPIDDLSRRLTVPNTMPKCGCKLGSMCMNAACPHGIRTTCRARDILGDQRLGVSVPVHGTML